MPMPIHLNFKTYINLIAYRTYKVLVPDIKYKEIDTFNHFLQNSTNNFEIYLYKNVNNSEN